MLKGISVKHVKKCKIRLKTYNKRLADMYNCNKYVSASNFRLYIFFIYKVNTKNEVIVLIK